LVNDAARALLAKARESLASARAGLEAGRLNGASSRGYYAMFHAARAALEARAITSRGQRHGAVIRRFGLTFVKNGPLDIAHGRNLNKALEIRNEGDYDVEPPNRDDVTATVRNAEAFVAAIAALIEHDES
jgi:uncharacterized protein (UPF0332 family)